jgi:molybdenum cofactor cytidylyltransferase
MSNIAVVVLAAGGSKRLGRAKQLEPIDGVSLVRRATLAALEIGPTIVVLGAAHEQVGAEIAGLGARIVVNAGWAAGMGGSIALGMTAVGSADAVLLTVCDQPRIDGDVLARVVHAFNTSPADIVAASYEGTVGVPAVFSSKHFDELRALEGDRGAKGIIERLGALAIECPEAAWDIDEEGDLSP